MRASTPFQTMFYGCPIPDTVNEGSEGSARVAATYETSYLMRKNLDGEQKLTFSRWLVKKPIPVFVVCHHEDFYGRNLYMQELFKTYLSLGKKMGQIEFEESLLLNTFFADEFAKHVVNDTDDFENMISAIFSETLIRNMEDNAEGIYYPSMRTDGMVFNIAITPERADDSLQLIAAGEGTLYKRGVRCFLDMESACEISDEHKPLNFLPLGTNQHLGRESL